MRYSKMKNSNHWLEKLAVSRIRNPIFSKNRISDHVQILRLLTNGWIVN